MQLNPITQRLVKNFSISLAGTVVLMLVGIVRTALLTKQLEVAVYGKTLIVLSFYGFLLAFVNVRTRDLLFKLYPEFEQHKNWSALRDLLRLCGGISLVAGLTLGALSWVVAPWVAEHLYHDPLLATPLRFYAWVMVFESFDQLTSGVLRIKDRFGHVVVPQVMGAIVSLAAIVVYVVPMGGREIGPIVLAFAAGTLVRTVPPMFSALIVIRSIFRDKVLEPRWRALRAHRKDVKHTLLQTNLVAQLKLPIDAGAMFLLGVFSTPEQVAYYGICRRVFDPIIRMLRNNLQAALFPEIMQLWAQRQYALLFRYVNRISRAAIYIGGLGLLVGIPLCRPVILLLSKEEYLAALPVFYVTLTAIYLSLISLVYYPVSLGMNWLGRRNLILLGRMGLLVFFLFYGLTALNIVVVELVGAVALRLFLDIPLRARLRTLTEES